MADRAPEPTELIYVPESSWSPALVALGLTGVLTGVFIWWPYGVIGAAIALAGVLGMWRGVSKDIERLPRRQKLTTAVLPAVPPRPPAR
jgi:hypothetical protein